MPPPREATLPDGGQVTLRPLAQSITDRHLQLHPEDLERYGEVGRQWCTHDNQHLLQWAAMDAAGQLDLNEQVAWLANILQARGYPLENLASNLQTAAEVINESLTDAAAPLATRLGNAAEILRRRQSR